MKSKAMFLSHPIWRSRKAYALLACVGIVMIGGCGGEESTETEDVPAPTNFNFTMVNKKSETITDVTIQGMALPVKYNKITAGSSQTLLAKSMDLSDTVEVAWTDRRGERSDADVQLKGNIPKRFDGSLKFTIQASGKVDFTAGTAP